MRRFPYSSGVAVLLGAFLPAQQEVERPRPVIDVGGLSFYSWAEYIQSDAFRELDLRCGIMASPNQFLMPPSDCSFTNTSIQPEYEPVGGTLYEIPVVVHIIENTNGDGQISNAMVQSQIDVLNEDFRAIAGTLGENGNDAVIEFYLADVDPNGNPTNGITHTVNNTWFNDSGNYWDVLAWDTANYLNIYTNSAGGFLGYVPDLPQGGLAGQNHDRVVVLWSAFGRNAPIGPPYDLGRTATHEVGHYFGLNHTFSGGCASPSSCYNNGDLICDTNPEGGPVFGCPASVTSCGLPAPFDNYMDYSDDICYEQFTPEQVNRMRCSIQHYREDLPLGTTPCNAATAVVRNAGTNPESLAMTNPVLGATMFMNVIDFTYNRATIISYTASNNQLLPGGRTLLVDTSSGFLFSKAINSLPGSTALVIPNDPSICGFQVYCQAILFGGGPPWALSNAVDLTLGD